MIGCRIILDAEGAFPEIQRAAEVTLDAVGLLTKGMHSGKASVILVLKGPNDTTTFAQTSLAMFMTIAAAFNKQYMKDQVL